MCLAVLAPFQTLLKHRIPAEETQFSYNLESPAFCERVAYAAKLVPSDLDRSRRSRMNFTRIEVLAAAARNSGRVFRRAMATTYSEGARPDRTVRIQEPNDRQTDLGAVAAGICSSPWAISPSS